MRAWGVVIGCILALVWFIGMAALGMAKQDEWYRHMDKPKVEISDVYTKIGA